MPTKLENLTETTTVQNADLFLVTQSGSSKKVQGSNMLPDSSVTYLKLSSQQKQWLMANGMGAVADRILPHPVMPNNFYIMDKDGNYDLYVFIPRGNWDFTNKFASGTIHPCFTAGAAGATVLNGIYIAKYQASNVSGIARSLPNLNPYTSINFDNARTACSAKNFTGENKHHLLTNAERAYIALWCKANSTMPYGNNQWGKDIDLPHVTGKLKVPAAFNDHTSEGVWAAGSGGIMTSHDRTANGIFDLNGNVWEWIDGLKLVSGQIYVMSNGAGSAGNKFTEAESSWIATGAFIGATNAFGSMGLASGSDPGYLKSLAILPTDTGSTYNGDYFYVDATGERVALFGGYWYIGGSAGVFALDLGNVRSSAYSGIGFRSAFVDL